MSFQELYADSPQFIADVAEFLQCEPSTVEVSAILMDGLFEENNLAHPSSSAIIHRSEQLSVFNPNWLGEVRFVELFGLRFVVSFFNGQYVTSFKIPEV